MKARVWSKQLVTGHTVSGVQFQQGQIAGRCCIWNVQWGESGQQEKERKEQG